MVKIFLFQQIVIFQYLKHVLWTKFTDVPQGWVSSESRGVQEGGKCLTQGEEGPSSHVTTQQTQEVKQHL